MFELTGRRVIITGAAQGFGKEFARRLLQENCCVCISDIDIDTGNKTKSEFQKEFELTENELCFVKCNVAVEQDWIDLWDNAEKLLNGPIEVLINNAGVHPGLGWKKNLDVNLYGMSHGVFLAIERMGRTNGGKGGRIVNISSVAGLSNSAVGVINNYGYNMAKHGIVALTRAFKFSEPKVYDTEGIKCFSLAPWFADTALVHSWMESAKEKPGSWMYEGKSLTSIEDIKTAGHMRILTVHEVGQGLIKALEYDNDGAVYAIIPDCPLIEYPINQTMEFMTVIGLAKYVAGHFNIELFTYKHFIAILVCIMFLIFYFCLSLFHWMI